MTSWRRNILTEGKIFYQCCNVFLETKYPDWWESVFLEII
jgi:hypothetical protein